MEKRESWLDYLRAFACVLVALGHLVMSFQEAAIIKNSMLASVFIQVIYHFHVYIFFFCSGYLFQSSFSKCACKTEYYRKKLVKCFDFILVYILFSGVTYFIKSILSGAVNSPVEQSFVTVLLMQPINQMWYMYAISIIMLCVPTIKSERGCACVLLVTVCLKVFMCFLPNGEVLPLPLKYLFENAIWFALGEIWFYKRVILNKWVTAVFAVLFLVFNAFEQVYNVDYAFLDAILTFWGILASEEIVRRITKDIKKMPLVWKLLSKYMFQIYLLHTICAAGIRIILLKLDIESFLIHFVMGIVFSFVVPILIACFAERVRVFNLVFYPSKTIKELTNK